MDHLRETYGPHSDCVIEYMTSLHKDGDLYKKRNKPGKVCMLPADHDGPHVWTLTDEIGVCFD